jgi:protein SCO1/2
MLSASMYLWAQEHHHGTAAHYSASSATYAIPRVTLRDANDQLVKLATLLNDNRPTILQFIFTTCTTVCPIMTATLAAAQERLGPELDQMRMVSISIDPENDTPARLREYAARFKARNQWIFLTGNVQDIVRVQESFQAYSGNKMNHQPLTFMRASAGPWTRLDGLMSADDFVHEYRLLSGRR